MAALFGQLLYEGQVQVEVLAFDHAQDLLLKKLDAAGGDVGAGGQRHGRNGAADVALDVAAQALLAAW